MHIKQHPASPALTALNNSAQLSLATIKLLSGRLQIAPQSIVLPKICWDPHHSPHLICDAEDSIIATFKGEETFIPPSTSEDFKEKKTGLLKQQSYMVQCFTVPY